MGHFLVSATTIRKEIATLGSVWKWAATIPLVSGQFPNRGLRYPKIDEKPPFQTWAEIEMQIQLNQLTIRECNVLWESLYLRKNEIIDLLEHVETNARHSFIYPMFVFAAFTGARRSEIVRSQRADFNFGQSIVKIRERKRLKGKRSTRYVPMTKRFKAVMTNWLTEVNSKSVDTFVNMSNPIRKRITVDQCRTHFGQTLKDSRWSKIKGWHCLRHSFISNLASKGVDQRIIDEFVGHSTEEMRCRYRHLFPDVKQSAIDSVFG